MRVGQTHLTYCTNIHPGESWPEVFENLRTHLLGVRELVAPEQAFGIGLRLSAAAAEALAERPALEVFQSFLAEQRLYVFTINGFPYGPFHGQAVKAEVYQPDWTRNERGAYTERLVRILSELLPAGMNGSISTVPAGFKRDLQAPADIERVVAQLHEQVVQLHRLRRERGQTIVLALEPEPCCLLETTRETVRFFEEALLSPRAVQALARQLDVERGEAEAVLFEHLGVCLDTCHAAVEFEEPEQTLADLATLGIRIAKIQASTGLRLPSPNEASLRALEAYDEPVYLHQVVARSHTGELLRFEDLGHAFANRAARGAEEWRVHFHVPLYREDLGKFSNTQGYLDGLLTHHLDSPVTDQIEVETYTWDVLPEEQRALGLVPSIARELGWVKERLTA